MPCHRSMIEGMNLQVSLNPLRFNNYHRSLCVQLSVSAMKYGQAQSYIHIIVYTSIVSTTNFYYILATDSEIGNLGEIGKCAAR